MLENIRFTRFRQLFIALPFFLLSLNFLSCFQPVALAQSVFPESTVLEPGDTVQLALKQHPYLNNLAGKYIVSPNGTIYIGGIEPILLAGQSVASGKKKIQRILHARTSTDPKVKFSLFEQKRFILMDHGVRYPGWYHVPLSPTIEELMSVASGLKPGATIDTAKISRVVAGESQEIVYKAALPIHSSDHLLLDVETNSEIIDNGDLLYVVVPREVSPTENAARERVYFMDEVEVDRYGYIFLSSQGNIKVAGHTTEEISQILTDNLPVYLKTNDKAEVNLISRKHYIQILGQIAQPGWYNIQEAANIQAIIHKAGGVIQGGDLRNILMIREENGQTKRLIADVHYYFLNGDDRMLPVLHENDTIFIPLAPVVEIPEEVASVEISQIRIFGAVNTPGMYPASKGMDILDLLLTAGGQIPEADISRIQIIRSNKKKEVFNLQSMLHNGASSMKNKLLILREDDIVFVPTQEDTATLPSATVERIRIYGAVNSPMSYPAPREGVDLLDILITAQGESADADLKKVSILRAKGDRELFDMTAMLRPDAQNVVLPQIYGGDVVHVARHPASATADLLDPTNLPEIITIIGLGSNEQGAQPFVSSMSPLRAIAQAGGMNEFADTNDIVIIRRIDGEQLNLHYNYDKALKGEKPDVDFQLQNNDIIYIP